MGRILELLSCFSRVAEPLLAEFQLRSAHGAGRLKRHSGTIAQPDNFPKSLKVES